MDKQTVLKAIYDLSDAKTGKDVHEILSRFKAPPSSPEQIEEELEDIIQGAIQSLLDLLKKINSDEEKAAEVSGFDNNILEIDSEEEAPKTPEELATWISRVSVPPPPGTIDPNETGIPDNSRKDVNNDIMSQVLEDPDHPPYILERPYPFQIGDYISWEGTLGRSYGRIEDIRLTGAIEIADSPLSMLATYEDPVCICRIWRIDNGKGGWLPTDTTFPLKMSVLHHIDPLEPPTDIAPTIPNTQGSKHLEEVIRAKKLSVKAVGGQLRGSLVATIKSSSSDSSYVMSTEDEALIEAEWIPEGSVIRDIVAADLLEDRGFERFTNVSLDGLAKGYPKKPMLLDHEWSAHQIVGKVLKAKNDSGRLVLRSFFPNTEKNSWVVDAIKSGIFTMVSVGFAADPEDMRCSACKRSMFDNSCTHQPGDVLKDGSRVNLIYKGVADVFECSIIPVPMQPEAHIMPSKDLNAHVLQKGGLIQPIVPIGTPDTIPVDTSTIGNSLKMSDNLSGIAPVGTEAVTPGPQELGLMPAAAINPPESGTLDSPPSTSAVKETDEDDAKTKEAGSEPSLTDVHKMIGEMRTVTEGAYSEMCMKMDKIAETTTDIQGKAVELLGNFKAVPASEGAGAELKAFVDTATQLLQRLEAKEKAMEAAQEEHKKSLADLHKKLDIAMTASTEGVMKLLLEENVPQEPVRSNAKKSLWIHDYFGQKTDDQGGQK